MTLSPHLPRIPRGLAAGMNGRRRDPPRGVQYPAGRWGDLFKLASRSSKPSEVRPEKFFFGAATSAHQVEGGNHNDWTEWEARSAKFKVASSKLKVWPDYILNNYPNPLQEENYISGWASDHYNRFREDFDIAKSLGHNAHRFSIEWSRIEPEEGKFNQKEIEHYRCVIQALHERGMEPFVTLWHWTLPLWVRERGGWKNRRTIEYFARYAEKIVLEFKDEVTFFITLNEPVLWCSNAYRTGNFPPQKKDFFSAYRVFLNLRQGHKEAYRRMKAIDKNLQIGVTQNMGWFDLKLLRPFYYFFILFFLKSINNASDYIGIDYYRKIPFLRKSKPDSDIGWEIYPEGLYKTLTYVWERFKKPIYILENGIADAKDAKRQDFIRTHIAEMKKAMTEGVAVRGYFHWSLLDNFEWENGFWPRFGLVEIDYKSKTLERKIRPSALEYKKIIERNFS